MHVHASHAARFLPPFSKMHKVVLITEDGILKKEAEQGRAAELDLATWMLAWDGYALGAAMTEQLAYPDTWKHRNHIMRVACREGGQVAVVYDRLVR